MQWTSPYIKTDEDRLWIDEGLRFGYQLRPPAHRFLRWPVIRHLRAFAMEWRIQSINNAYDVLGVKMRADEEAWQVHAIWRGWQ